MKILALEKQVDGVTPEQCKPYLKAESRRVLELMHEDMLREIYFRADWPGAVLILECGDEHEAERVLNTLPLVWAGLIKFEIIPLKPYPGFARLFEDLG